MTHAVIMVILAKTTSNLDAHLVGEKNVVKKHSSGFSFMNGFDNAITSSTNKFE